MSEDLTAAAINQDEAEFWKNRTRTGGRYLPPARLAQLSRDITDKSSEAFQRLSWEALKKSLTGIVNRVNSQNLKFVMKELFSENLIRGRGLLVKALIRSQVDYTSYLQEVAAMVAIVNTKMPAVGELLLSRLVCQFRRCYKRNDKAKCQHHAAFIAQLVIHRVAHEILILQLFMLLLENPSNDSVEIAAYLMREVGGFLLNNAPRPTHAIFERFRAILTEGSIDKSAQYMIEVLFKIRQEGFKSPIKPELDLVDEEDQITHYCTLDDEVDIHEELDVFQYDPDFLFHEEEYSKIKEEILGNNDDDEEEGNEEQPLDNSSGQQVIKDETGTDVISLRKTIYLTVMSSLDVDECGHKLLKINLPEGYEIELCNMIVECCAQERTFLKYYALLAERFCRLNVIWEEQFAKCFGLVYASIHNLDTGRIRNVARLFGHLLETDAIPWTVLACVRLTEDDTNQSSRIFLKFLFEELSEFFSVASLNERLQEPSLQEFFAGVFPRDSLRNIRFSIKFFEAVDLPLLADGQRRFIMDLEAELDAEEQRQITN